MKRGEVVYLNLAPPDPGKPSHVQAGRRPAIIVQVDPAADGTRTLVVVPLTSRLKAKRFPFAVVIEPSVLNGLDRTSVALVHQIAAYDRRDIDGPVGEIDPIDIGRLDESLRDFLGLVGP